MIKYSPGIPFSTLIGKFGEAMFLFFLNDNTLYRTQMILENENNNKEHVLTHASGNPKKSVLQCVCMAGRIRISFSPFSCLCRLCLNVPLCSRVFSFITSTINNNTYIV